MLEKFYTDEEGILWFKKINPGDVVDLICDCKEDLEEWLEFTNVDDQETFKILDRIDEFLNT